MYYPRAIIPFKTQFRISVKNYGLTYHSGIICCVPALLIQYLSRCTGLHCVTEKAMMLWKHSHS